MFVFVGTREIDDNIYGIFIIVCLVFKNLSGYTIFMKQIQGYPQKDETSETIVRNFFSPFSNPRYMNT